MLVHNQYARRECLVITGRPETTETRNLEDLTLKVLNEIGVNVRFRNLEVCNCHSSVIKRHKMPIKSKSRRKS